MAEPGLRELIPWKQLTGVFLAGGGNVGMGENLFRLDGPAAAQILCERDDSGDLRFRKAAIAPFMAGIGNLNTDGP